MNSDFDLSMPCCHFISCYFSSHRCGWTYVCLYIRTHIPTCICIYIYIHPELRILNYRSKTGKRAGPLKREQEGASCAGAKAQDKGACTSCLRRSLKMVVWLSLPLLLSGLSSHIARLKVLSLSRKSAAQKRLSQVIIGVEICNLSKS